ncbi:MAG: ABC transporter substrate-binding protein [Dehalococcoidia bacterium]|nr:ABC transporter substrate-binding protein [Dehalococcoidia bacterium]
MPRFSRTLALPLVVPLVLLLLLIACGDDDDAPAPAPTPEATEATEATEPPPATEPPATAQPTEPPATESAGTPSPTPTAAPPTEAPPERVALHVGLLVPETGAVGPLAAPAIEAMKLAVEDINAAGGNVTTTIADTATNPATGREAAARLLGEGADVIVGPATSAVTQAVIQALFDERVPQCTPSAQSPAFSTQENAAYFFRTVPPAHAVAPIMARVVAEDGGTRVAIVGRADDYGTPISGLVAQLLTELGAEAEVVLYDPGSTTFDSQVAAVAAYGPDAIINIGFFFDGTSIVHGLIEAGFGPEIQYGGDALFHPYLWQLVDPNDPTVLDGMKFIGVAGSDEFNTRISDVTDGNVNFAAQSYDCVVLMALAAELAGSTDGDAIMEAIAGLTHHGTECYSYEECLTLIDAGEDIDYVGVSGPINFTPNGDPTTGSYAVFQFQGGQITVLQAYEVDLTQLQ